MATPAAEAPAPNRSDPHSGPNQLTPRETAENYRAIIEQNTEGIVLLNEQGAIIEWNHAMEKISGIAIAEALGKPLWEIQEKAAVAQGPGSKDREKMIRAMVLDALRSGVSPIFGRPSILPLNRNGETVLVEQTLFPVKTEKGYRIGCVIHDVSDQKKAEEKAKIQLDLGIALSRVSDLKNGLDLCLDAALRISGMDSGGIYLLEPESGDLVLRNHTGLSDQFIALVGRYSPGSKSSEVVVAGKPVYAHYNDIPTVKNATQTDEGLKAIAIIPFRNEDRINGCLNVASHRIDTLPEGEKVALEIITTHIGNAVARLHAEERKRESEERYRIVTSLTTDYIFRLTVDDAGVVAMDMATENMTAATGRTVPETRTPLQWEKIIHPDDYGRLTMLLKRLVEKGGTGEFEGRSFIKSGTQRWIQVVARAEHGGTPERTRSIVGAVKDISDRKNAEENLRRSEERFRKIFEGAPIGMAILSSKAHFAKVNGAFCAMLGFTEEELVQRSFRDVTHSEHVQADMANVQRLAKGEIPLYKTEKRYLTKDGRVIWGAATIACIRFEGTEEFQFLAMVEDVTLRKQAEQQLAEEKERLTVTLRSIGDGVIATDTNGSVMLMNRVAETLTGWEQQEAMGKPLEAVFSKIDMQTGRPCENPAAMAMKNGAVTAISSNTQLIARDGMKRIITDSGAPIRDKNSRIVGVVLVFRDVTDKLKTDEALASSAKLESLGVLAGGIAHDFNNLLSGVFGNLDLARVYLDENDTANALSTISRAMAVFERARALTQQLLTFSKGGTPVRKTMAIEPLIQATVAFALSGSNVAREFHIQPNLKPCNIDENQIGQVVDNIVINALQAMPGGGAIAVSARNVTIENDRHPVLEGGEYVEISVRDTGIGIPHEILPRIFDPFFTTKQKGSGLGLAISFSIIKRHGGVIEVESMPGRGTTFRIFLPAASGALAATATVQAGHFKGHGTVLIMDDEIFILDVASKLLKKMGFTTLTALNGDEAIKIAGECKARGEKIDLAILDLTNPGGRGGKETAQPLLAIDPEIKLIVSSGYSDDPVMANPEEYGFKGRFFKPFRIEEMVEVFRKLMER